MSVEYIIKSLLKPVCKLWYWYISKRDLMGEVNFLNYGFDNDKRIQLLKEDEPERYPLQLYHHVLSAIEIKNKRLLEVGCGRGGGSSYIARYFEPESVKAVDISGKAIDYCRLNHVIPVCEYIKADAQNLPFSDDTFDIVINIESSLYYPDIDKFFDEVYRVLKPEGHFLYADFRYSININTLKEKLNTSKYIIKRREDITKGVLKALEADNERRLNLIKRLVPKVLQAPMKDFAGVKNLNTYRSFAKGRWEYYSYILQKQ